jgi:IPT/TIG domain
MSSATSIGFHSGFRCKQHYITQTGNSMKKIFSFRNHIMSAALASGLMLVLFAGCKEDPPPSLYDSALPPTGAQPVISSIAPPGSALAGVSVLTITGSNFSPVASDNLVFFDASPGTVVDASPTQLHVRAPELVKDSIEVKVAVLQSALFSVPMLYRLDAAVSEFGRLTNSLEPLGVAADADGNVYVSMLLNSARDSVYKITPAGVRTGFSIGFSSSIPRYTALKVGPDGIYGAALRNAIFLIPPTGGAAAVWVVGGGLGTLYDFDFDQQLNIWAGGNNQSIYRITPAKAVKAFPFVGDVRSVRVFQNQIYLGAKVDSVWGVWRFPIISSDSLGPVEKYFDVTANNGSANGAYAVTFAADGDMFVGTDAGAGSIILVRPDRSSEPFYPGLFKAQHILFAYTRGTDMYSVRTGPAADNADKKLILINTQKPGAPYYGRGD